MNYDSKNSSSNISNIKFLKNFSYRDGVKVTRYLISSNEQYTQQILERNFFCNKKLSFSLVQQITTDDLSKYFIFGIKCDDLYIKVNTISFLANYQQVKNGKSNICL